MVLLAGLALSAAVAVTVVMPMISTTGVRTVPVNYFARISCEPDKPFVLVARDASGAVVGTSRISGTFSESMQFCLVRGAMELEIGWAAHRDGCARGESGADAASAPVHGRTSGGPSLLWIGANPSSQGPPAPPPQVVRPTAPQPDRAL